MSEHRRAGARNERRPEERSDPESTIRTVSGWQNWGRSVRSAPAVVCAPGDEEELRKALARAASGRQQVRAVGAGHSFTPIAATDGMQLRLDRLSGVLRVSGTEVTLGAGTRLRDLPALLGPWGLALENMGDIDSQTIAGAINTGTHGTGRDFTGIAGQVTGLRLMLADGTTLDCTAEQHPELFQAARIGLGAFGILTQVTIRCAPAFLLQATESPEPLAAVLAGFDGITAGADHVEFYWFPHTGTALVKRNRRLPVGAEPNPLPAWKELLDDEIVANGVFQIACGVGSLVPALVPPINRLAAGLVSERTFTDSSQAVFTSPRRVRFREMEYGIDLDSAAMAIEEIRALIARRGWRISFPLEVRTAAADQVWLSTAYRRPTAYIAAHRYFREGFAEYFLALEQILLRHGGRPHWGKLHTLGADQFAERYPRFDQVRRIRAEVDPDGLFGNPYLRRVFGSS